GDAPPMDSPAPPMDSPAPPMDSPAPPRDTPAPPADAPMDSRADGSTGCPAGQTLCGASCVSTSTDTANCGGGSRPCMAGQTCAGGMCVGGMTMGCPAPPAGTGAQAVAAHNLENAVRTAMGIPCATMVTAANLGAERHCAYYAANRSTPSCVGNPHVEVSGCS